MRPGTKARGWRRHLDGWQAAALVVVLAGSAILVGMPRSVRPEALPEVQVDRAFLESRAREDDRLASQAEETRLDHDIRALGSEFRSYNRAAASDDPDRLVEARTKLSRAAVIALKRSADELAALRAYQLRRFLDEVARWQADGSPSDELIELSGDFIDALRRNRWCRGGERQLVADEHVLRVLWKKRWNELTGVRGPLFDLGVEEDRLRYGFLIQHPFMRRSETQRAGFSDRVEEVYAHKARLVTMERLAAIDPSYPLQLGRGVVLYQMADYGGAASAFRAHLDAHPDGPYTLRARNYLKAALDRLGEMGM